MTVLWVLGGFGGAGALERDGRVSERRESGRRRRARARRDGGRSWRAGARGRARAPPNRVDVEDDGPMTSTGARARPRGRARATRPRSLPQTALFRDPSTLTALVVQLPQDLADDLPDALQRLEVVLRLVVRLLEVAHGLAQRAHAAVDLLVPQQSLAVVRERRGLALGLDIGRGRGRRRRGRFGRGRAHGVAVCAGRLPCPPLLWLAGGRRGWVGTRGSLTRGGLGSDAARARACCGESVYDVRRRLLVLVLVRLERGEAV